MNFKENKKLTIAFIVFALMTVYFFCHILYWYVNNNATDSVVGGISDEETVGYEEPTATAKEKKQPTFPFASVDFDKLKKRNPDTVAWLKVPAIDLNIPIVQTVDNDFYLEHDIERKKNKLGWVFADARSNIEHLGVNTVLYGHNAASRAMFGSLKGLLNTDPEMKKENEVIQFTTANREMVFEITSIYVTHYDDWKYVQQDFGGEKDKRTFIDRMSKKNTTKVFARNNLSTNDKFLTFSTCYGPAGTTERLVVHARLVAEKEVGV